MSIENLFEYATRHKLRFSSTRGELSVEQLWDVPLRSRSVGASIDSRNDDFSLDTVAKSANRALKALTEESFVDTERTPAVTKAEAILAVVKYVIETKLAEETTAKRRAENLSEKSKLLKILAEKQDGKLSELSEKELQKRIAALE